MFLVGHREVDGLDVLGVQQGVELIIGTDMPLFGGVLREGFRRSAGPAAGDGDEFGIRGFHDGGQQALIDARCAQDAPAELGYVVHGFTCLGWVWYEVREAGSITQRGSIPVDASKKGACPAAMPARS